MQIERIDETQLSPTDETAINVLLRRAFGNDFGNRSFHQQRHSFRLIIRQGPQVVGHMALCYRAVRLGDNLFNVIGLAEVSTDPDLQGQGIASALMREAIAQAKATQADFFMLFGDKSLYAGNGFQKKNNVLIYTDFHDAKTGAIHHEPAKGLMTLPLTDMPWDDTATLDLLGHAF
jgi:predicted N-acetyltransferase YhbS